VVSINKAYYAHTVELGTFDANLHGLLCHDLPVPSVLCDAIAVVAADFMVSITKATHTFSVV
jgi:hypothetical protein